MKIQRLSGRGFLNGEKGRKNKGDDLMKDRQFHIYLDDEEYGQVLQALIALKNNLILPVSLFPVPSHADGRRSRRHIFEELAR